MRTKLQTFLNISTASIYRKQNEENRKQALCYTAFSLPSCTYGSLQSVNRGREDLGLVQMILHDMPATPKSGQPYHGSLFLRHPWRRSDEEKSSLWAEPGAVAPGCSLSLEGKMARYGIMCQFVGSGQWFGWMVRNLGLGKLLTRKFWEELCVKTSLNGKTNKQTKSMKTVISYAHQRVTSSIGGFE